MEGPALRRRVEDLLYRLDGPVLAEAMRRVRQAETAVVSAVAPFDLELARCEASLLNATQMLEAARRPGDDQECVDRSAQELEQCMAMRVEASTNLLQGQERALAAQHETWLSVLEEFGGPPEPPSVVLYVSCAGGPEDVAAPVAFIIDERGRTIDEDFTLISPSDAGSSGVVARGAGGVKAVKCAKKEVIESLDRLPPGERDVKLRMLLSVQVQPLPGSGMGLHLTDVNVIGSVVAGGAAEAAGLRQGDIIVATDGAYLGSNQLSQAIDRALPSHVFGVVRPVQTSATDDAPDGLNDAEEALSGLQQNIAALIEKSFGIEPSGPDSTLNGGRASGEDAGRWGEVRFVQLEAADGNAITVGWEASSGMDASCYQLEWRVAHMTEWTHTVASSKLALPKVTKKNLEPEAFYQFRVRACDSFGHWHPFCETEHSVRPDGAGIAPPPVTRDEHLEKLASQRRKMLVDEDQRVSKVRLEYLDRLSQTQAELDGWKAKATHAQAALRDAIDPVEQESRFSRAKQEARDEVEREANTKVALVMRNAAADIRDKVKAVEERAAAAVERATDEAVKKAQAKAEVEKKLALRQLEEAYDRRLVTVQTRLGAGAQQHAQQLEERQREAVVEGAALAVAEAERAAEARQARAVKAAADAAIRQTEESCRHTHAQLEQQILSLKHQLHVASRNLVQTEAGRMGATARMTEDIREAVAAAVAKAETKAARQMQQLEDRMKQQLDAVVQGQISAAELIRVRREEECARELADARRDPRNDSFETGGVLPDSFDSTALVALENTSTKKHLSEDKLAKAVAQAEVERARLKVKRMEELCAAASSRGFSEDVEMMTKRLHAASQELEAAEGRAAQQSLALQCSPVAAAAGAYSIAVDWLGPPGACKYHLQWREEGGAGWADSRASEELQVPCCTKAGLRTHAKYEFRVRATNQLAEWGPWSTPSDPTTPSAMLDAFCSRPLATLLPGARVKVTWAPPLTSSTVVEYELQWRKLSSPNSEWSAMNVITLSQPEYVSERQYLSAVYVYRVRAQLQGFAQATWSEFGPCSAPVQPKFVDRASSNESGNSERTAELTTLGAAEAEAGEENALHDLD